MHLTFSEIRRRRTRIQEDEEKKSKKRRAKEKNSGEQGSVTHNIRYSFCSMIERKVYLTVFDGNSIKSNHDSHESCAFGVHGNEFNTENRFDCVFYDCMIPILNEISFGKRSIC